MKKLLSALLCFVVTTGAMAEGIKVANVTLPQNTSAEIQIELDNPSVAYESFTMQIELPEGVVPVMANNGYPSFTVSSRLSNQLTTGYKTGNIATFARLTDGNAITGTSGLLFSTFVKVEGDVAVGTELTAKVSAIKFTTTSLTTDILDDVTFTITIGEPADTRTILDETSTTAPAAATGVDVRVKRTIKANEWSTICLPFAMTAAQMTAAFGDDVQLGDFNDYEFDDDTETINVKFNTATAIEANHPYIIKIGEGVTEFTVDGVDVDPQEAVVDFDTSRRKNQPRQMVGTYTAGTTLEWGSLFLSGNQYWYSVGSTTMKAFRAYFYFYNLLPDFENNYESRSISMSFDDETTGVSDVRGKMEDGRGEVYDLQGRKVVKPVKGMYIINGRKEVLK